MSSFKDVYNYAIDVRPVDSCPINGSEWQAAAARAGCNGTRGYHCVPDKFHSRLIEFCYNKTRILVPEGIRYHTKSVYSNIYFKNMFKKFLKKNALSNNKIENIKVKDRSSKL